MENMKNLKEELENSLEDYNSLVRIVKCALLDPSKQLRQDSIDMLAKEELCYDFKRKKFVLSHHWPGENIHYSEPFKIKSVSVGDNQIFLKIQQEFKKPEIAYLCELPKTYIDPVKPEHIHPFIIKT